MEPGAGPRTGADLDKAPPQPPGQRKRATLMELQTSPTAAQNIGPEAGNPQVMIIQYLGQLQAAAQGIGSLLPALGPGLNQLVQSLQQVIPQAMADQLAGVSSAGAGGGSPIPGGAAAPAGPPGVGGPPAGPPVPAGVMGA